MSRNSIFRLSGFRPGYGTEITSVMLVKILHAGEGQVLLDLSSAFSMTEHETILLFCPKFLVSICKFSTPSTGLRLNEPEQDV